jgi:hypothetical protein
LGAINEMSQTGQDLRTPALPTWLMLMPETTYQLPPT